ncbi:hypothetical protein LCGC14_1791030 [marine sediment metagenome]|uniref:Uncharacterized protein n=1 Tax=marine sediment metagenome TaxID=412755 RepID=A0A0F9GSK6_9ZZZZ
MGLKERIRQVLGKDKQEKPSNPASSPVLPLNTFKMHRTLWKIGGVEVKEVSKTTYTVKAQFTNLGETPCELEVRLCLKDKYKLENLGKRHQTLVYPSQTITLKDTIETHPHFVPAYFQVKGLDSYYSFNLIVHTTPMTVTPKSPPRRKKNAA